MDLQTYADEPKQHDVPNGGNLHKDKRCDVMISVKSNCLFLPSLLGQSAAEHCAFVSVVSGSLCVFLAVFVLVCTEMLSQRWRRLLGLVVWATHLTMGYTFIFSGPIVVPWDQVTSPTRRVHLDFLVEVIIPAYVNIQRGDHGQQM